MLTSRATAALTVVRHLNETTNSHIDNSDSNNWNDFLRPNQK